MPCLQVFKAVLDGHTEVAVKFLNPADVGTHSAAKERFEAEIQIMLLCDHPNIVKCQGAWIDKVSCISYPIPCVSLNTHVYRSVVALVA